MNVKEANNIDELIELYNDGEFYVESKAGKIKVPQEGYVFDEDKSVKWNNEQREILIKRKSEAFQDYCESKRRAEDNLWNQVENLYASEYNLSKEQVGIARIKAYQDRHSDGFVPVIDELDELLRMIVNVMKSSMRSTS